jgi:hypothetical protein
VHPDELMLNDYVEGALAPRHASEVAQHLDGCVACRELVRDLSEIREAAAALPLLEPPPDVWRAVSQSLGVSSPSGGARRRAPTHFALAAAAILVLTTTVTWLVAPLVRSEPPDTRDLAEAVVIELRQAEEHYQNAIAALERIVQAEAGALDPETSAALRSSLAIIDHAIGESRAAIEAQPNSEPARLSLIDNYRQKIALLQRTLALTGELRVREPDEPPVLPAAQSRGTV